MKPDDYALAADALLVLHTAFVVFVIGGQIMVLHGWRVGWSWTRNTVFRLVHLAVVVFVVLETWLGFACPLTVWENWLRVRAGQTIYDDIGCIAHWLQKILFYSAPGWAFNVIYTVFALVVLISFVRYPPRGNIGWKRRSNRAE
ncbi:MAG TPA: DUF2784 domain-containing protein [Burkholderiales bacterium]|nr:DUF2784 domain-containing protein [Burkholderiales bacterium]